MPIGIMLGLCRCKFPGGDGVLKSAKRRVRSGGMNSLRESGRDSVFVGRGGMMFMGALRGAIVAVRMLVGIKCVFGIH